jgi:hypothetical protein
MKRKLGVAATVGALLLALTLVLAACGGDDDSDGVASLNGSTAQSENGDGSSKAEQDPQEAALDYAKCMREHGIDMPDPVNGRIELNVDPNVPVEKVEKAQKACKDILEKAGPQLSEEQQNALQDAQLAFAKCMRDHGIDMPDPRFGEGGIVTQQDTPGNGIDPEDPKYQKAQRACEPIMERARRKANLPEARPGLGRSGSDS